MELAGKQLTQFSGSIPGQEARPHTPQLKIPHAETKAR